MNDRTQAHTQAHTQTHSRSRLAHDFLGDALEPPFDATALRKGMLRTLLFSRLRVRALIVALGTVSTFVGLLAPWYQKTFVDGLLGEGGGSGLAMAVADTGALVMAMLFAFGTMFASQALLAVTRLLCVRESTLAQRWVSSALYEHTLALDSRARGAKTVGESVSLYAQDVQAACNVLDDVVPNTIASLVPLVAAPLAMGLVLDVPLWPPVLVSALSVGTCLLLSRRQARLFGLMKVYAERRLSLVNEWLQNVRAVRVLGWMEFFEARIFKARAEESVNRLAMVTNGSTMNSIAQVAPFLVNVAGVVGFLAATTRTPTPGDIFSLLWIFGVFLVRPIRMLPWAIVVAVDAQTSCRRLEAYFALSTEPGEGTQDESTAGRAQPTEDALVVEGLTLKAGERHLLYDVNLRIAQGELVALVGEVGAGKTLLLQSLLRETSATFRRYEIAGHDVLSSPVARVRRHFGYVPQDSFVMSASLRDNVSFEYGSANANEDAVLESLSLADFAPARERLEEGLESEIGERGVNLSGGQRQRVNLARAHFHGRDIVLLDDALSALDVDTEARVRHRLLQGAWRGKARVLVTHRLSILPYCDRVVFLEDGVIKAEGTFAELLQNSDVVRAFVKSLERAERTGPEALAQRGGKP